MKQSRKRREEIDMNDRSNGATTHVAREFRTVLNEAVGDITPCHHPVHSPSHYKAGGFEVVEIIEAFAPTNVHRSHALKYLLRAGRKGTGAAAVAKRAEDLQKAMWWIKRELSLHGESFTEECSNENA